LRLKKDKALAALDTFIGAEHGRFLSLTSQDLDRAAGLWADSRRRGVVTADPHALDIDVILAAQALNSSIPTSDFVVATSNVSHLKEFVPAEEWLAI
jgi:hypothetical protein